MPRTVERNPLSDLPAVDLSDETAGRKFLNQFVPLRSPANLAFDNLMDRRILCTKSLDRALLVLGNFFWIDDSADGTASAWDLKGRSEFEAKLDLSMHRWISDPQLNTFCKVGGVESNDSVFIAFSVAAPLLQTRGIRVLPKNGGAIGAAVDSQGCLKLPRESFLLDRRGCCHEFSLSHSVPAKFSTAFANLERVYQNFIKTMGR